MCAITENGSLGDTFKIGGDVPAVNLITLKACVCGIVGDVLGDTAVIEQNECGVDIFVI